MAEPDDRYRVAIQQCEHLASEIFAERARHARELAAEREHSRIAAAAAAAAARDETARLGHRLAYAHAVIKDMERSRFWRMRLIWVHLRRRLGGGQS
jgi:hypothetical protein